MSRINQLLFGFIFFSLTLSFGWYVWQSGPVAVDLQVSTEEDNPVVVQLSAKSTIQGNYQIEMVDSPVRGTVTIQHDRHLYLPDKNYFGEDHFTYRVRTATKSSSPAKVSIQITPVNDRPIAASFKLTTPEDTPVDIQLSGQDSDGDNVFFQLVNEPRHGKLSGTPPELTYIPATDYNGLDFLEYQVSDQSLTSETAKISITVTPINDPPQAFNDFLTTFKNSPKALIFKGHDRDNEEIRFEIVEPPHYGTVKKSNGQYTYYPQKGYTGLDRITFVAKDSMYISEKAEIEIEVEEIKQNAKLEKVLTGFIDDGGVAIGDDQKPEHLFHAGKYTPASVLKIVTASAALYHLGRDFRFKTEFYLDSDRNLYVKGYGDPSLSSKDWHEIASVLQEKELFEQDMGSLIIDTTVFSDSLEVDGRRETIHYYDSPPSVLASNYNTVAVRIKKDRRIAIVDDYTPLTSLVVKKAKQLPTGYQYFNVALNSDESIQYSAELVEEIFKEYGALFEDVVIGGRVPSGLTPIVVYQSPLNLTQVITEMLRDSNNFVANQLLLALAYQKKGEGVTIADGAEIVTRFLVEEIGLKAKDFALVEGSGLSTGNSIDLLAMLKIVNYFKKYRGLLPHLSASKYADLAKAGRRWNIMAKSGTLNHTATLAGFIQLDNNEWKPFVIMLNDDSEKRGAVLEIIAQYYAG